MRRGQRELEEKKEGRGRRGEEKMTLGGQWDGASGIPPGELLFLVVAGLRLYSWGYK